MPHTVKKVPFDGSMISLIPNWETMPINNNAI